jgi:tRNA pseudouridine55 synthase
VSAAFHGTDGVSGLHGWLILDKPLGLGSTNAVSAVKRALRQGGYGKAKVGHGGTLDPLATGVLPIAIGEATKLAGRMLDASKVYDFTVKFGEETDTLDAEGKVIATSDVLPLFADIEAVLPRFTGLIEQAPPAYSALKVDGERAYDLARAGEAVELAVRRVTVFSLIQSSPLGGGVGAADGGGQGTIVEDTALAPSGTLRAPPPPGGEDFITLTAHVSKGTYIRSLARDIALALGTVGHVTMLRRTRAGPFGLDGAISLDKLDEAATGQTLEALLRPIEAGLDGIPALPLTPDQAAALRQGRVLFREAVDDGLHFATLDAVPVALVEATAGAIRVERGFNF